MNNQKHTWAEIVSRKITYWVGTPASILVHTFLFIGSFVLIPVFGIERVMLALTTIVSLEAIYLSLFIQMTVNRQHKKLTNLEEDIDDILEDTGELTK